MKRYAIKVEVSFTEVGSYNANTKFEFQETCPISKHPILYCKKRILAEFKRIEECSAILEDLIEFKPQETVAIDDNRIPF